MVWVYWNMAAIPRVDSFSSSLIYDRRSICIDISLFTFIFLSNSLLLNCWIVKLDILELKFEKQR